MSTAAKRPPVQRATASIQHSAEQATVDLWEHLKTWGRDNPPAAAACLFAAGFVLGWRLKPW